MTDLDERLAFDEVVDPFFDVEYDLGSQTGSDWYNLALSASFGGKALHGFSYSTTSETLSKTTYEFAEKHAVGTIKTQDRVMDVPQPGEDWDEQLYSAYLHTGVQTGSQLSMMFDTGYWEPSVATRARNAAFLAAGMVTHGMKMSTALDITSKIAGDEVDEAAVLNTVIPVSHLKREAAGGAKASHAIFSRMNAQRNIRWEDSQLHQGVLPPNAAMDWARLAVIARYIGEVNTRYDPKFRMLAQIRGIPYMIIRGAWAYVAETDYLVDNKAWSLVPSPDSVAVQRGALMGAYKEHAAELTKQVMRTYNELTTGAKDANLESLLRLVEQMKPKKGPKVSTLSVGTDSFAAITSHTQTAAQAAAATANSATAYNAIVSAFSDFVSPDRNLTQKAAQITALRWDFEEAYPLLGQFYPIMASSHTWIRAFEHLDSLLKNPQTSVNRLNRLHRSMTDSSATIEVDVALTAKNRKHMAPHIVAILKKVMVARAPDNKLPRFVTDLRTAIARGHQQSLVAGLSEHFNDYRLKWAKRYEDWARVYGLAHGHRRDSILYGAAAVAFSSLTANHLLSPTSGFIDGSHLRSAYLVKMAHDYARKRKLNKPNLPPYPIASAKQLAEILDNQYAPDVSFKDCEEFARERVDVCGGLGDWGRTTRASRG